MRVAVLGVGLIGGSIGLAARRRAGAEVLGFDLRREAAGEGVALGALDAAADSLQAAVADADFCFVAAPVGATAALARAALAAAGPDCVVSDVGSTKRAVVAEVDDPRFIGGHPLAGAESAGVAHAREDLFDGATWFLTPTAATPGIPFERLHRLLADLGARPASLDAGSHDRLMASASHMPHVLANVMAARGARVLDAHGERPLHAGPSLRDATRVAGANTSMWTDVYLSNADVLVEEIDAVLGELRSIRGWLQHRDGAAIATWNDAARADRDRLLRAGSGAGAVRELRIGVPNRPGVVAEVALALGRGGVNIVDLALEPAPDGRSGSIGVWVDGDAAAADAERLVGALGLTVTRP